MSTRRSRLQGFISEWVSEPTNQPWGHRSMLFRDPDGNLIIFFGPIRRATKRGAQHKEARCGAALERGLAESRVVHSNPEEPS